MWKQVDDLTKAANSIGTLKSLLDHDIERGSVRKAGSHSRNLLRVKRGLDMVRVLFEQILASEYVSNSSSNSGWFKCLRSIVLLLTWRALHSDYAENGHGIVAMSMCEYILCHWRS